MRETAKRTRDGRVTATERIAERVEALRQFYGPEYEKPHAVLELLGAAILVCQDVAGCDATVKTLRRYAKALERGTECGKAYRDELN